jgi:hypothetical protein
MALIWEELSAPTCVVLSAWTSVVDSCRMAVVLREAICRRLRDVTIDMERAPVREYARHSHEHFGPVHAWWRGNPARDLRADLKGRIAGERAAA